MAMRSAGSPMIRAASAFCSISAGFGAASTNSGDDAPEVGAPESSHRATVARELVSRAMRLARSIGRFDTTSRLRISPSAGNRHPRQRNVLSMRWYSIDGMIATSTSPRFSASAHCEGTVNERSYLPASGPSVNPHTSGAVFRNSTIDMRNFLNVFPSLKNIAHGLRFNSETVYVETRTCLGVGERIGFAASLPLAAPLSMDANDYLGWIALALTPGLGARTAGKLLSQVRQPDAVFSASLTALEAQQHPRRGGSGHPFAPADERRGQGNRTGAGSRMPPADLGRTRVSGAAARNLRSAAYPVYTREY